MSWGSLAVAAFLAVFPLLPAGPGYLGIDAPYAADAAVGVLLVLWIVLRVAAFRRHDAVNATSAIAVLRAWLVLIAAVTGALWVALAAEIRPGSPVFAEDLAGLPWRIVQPLGFEWDPFYPARVWLTFVEGFLVFAIVRDCALRAESTHRFVRTASWGWLAGLGIVSTLALLQYLARFQLHPWWIARNPGLIRANATLDDPNLLAAYLVLGAGLALGIALSETRRANAMVAAAISLTASLAVLTTASRVALIALPLSALFVAAFGPTPVALVRAPLLRRIARGTLVGAGVIAIVLLAARLVLDERPPSLPTNPVEAMVETLDPRTSADQVFRNRFVYWGAAIRMAQQHPIAGIGVGRYPREAPKFQSRWVSVENTHNFFLQVQAEAGMLGLVAFATLWWIVIGALWRSARADDRTRAGLAWGAVIGMLAFGLTLLTGHALVTPAGQVLWGSAVALALVGTTPQNAPASRGKSFVSSAAFRASIFAVCVYAAAAWRMPSPPRLTDVWGYSWGLFPEERGFFPTTWNLLVLGGDTAPGPPGTRAAAFRWSGARAVLELQAPPGATECVLTFAAFPVRVTGAQSVTYNYGRTQRTVDVRTSDLQTLQIPLTPDVFDGHRRLVVRLAVTPAFVPAKLRMSPDRRTLGIQLFPPRFH